jgi:hypothetical protein
LLEKVYSLQDTLNSFIQNVGLWFPKYSKLENIFMLGALSGEKDKDCLCYYPEGLSVGL